MQKPFPLLRAIFVLRLLQKACFVVAASRQSAANYAALKSQAFCRKPLRRFCQGLVLCLSLASAFPAHARSVRDFDAGWLFSRGDFASAMMPAFKDTDWQAVTLPHDWSSDGPFAKEGGSGNGFAPGGLGWYRKHFSVAQNFSNQCVSGEFDGIYDFSEVWMNGQYVGGRPYGYSSFACDLTPFLKSGGDNVLAVRVDHSRFADSRFYTGSGIYRNARLVFTDAVHIARNGVFVLTPKVSEGETVVTVETTWTNEMNLDQEGAVQTTLLAPDGQVVAKPAASSRRFQAGKTAVCSQQVYFPHPQLWNLDDPKLYRAVSKIISAEGTILDEVTNTFGIREFHFDADKGFFLNGKSLKLKGVCLHHDAGPIGAAVPDKVLERRLRTLKEIGANAIRTSHNPPDPALLDMCDRLGFLVMDEAFDEWKPMKNKWVVARNEGAPSHFGYGEVFDQWAVTDVSDLVRRDRNHPSIILWSIGNEIDYANDPFSHPVLGAEFRPQNPRAENMPKLAKPLIAAVKALDPTRPVTMALANVAMSDAVGLPELLDMAGYNYQEGRYADDHKKFPKRIIYGSENSHQLNAWEAVATNDFIAGQFLWTGADYLGEANEWPNRASPPGLLDLCGFKKPLGWFRQSLWADKPMVYLSVSSGFGGRRGFAGVESWNWRSNETVSALCVANCPNVELLLNGKSIGTQKLSEARRGMLRWEIPFEPGTLQAVGRDDSGRELCRCALRTAGAPARIELLPDPKELRADGKDVCHVEFRIVDANGVRVPSADSEVAFTLTGPAKILGIGNGDVNSVEDCKSNKHHIFLGRGLAILQTTDRSGEITVQATATGLEPGTLILQSR
jgi:beta-galactosidase